MTAVTRVTGRSLVLPDAFRIVRAVYVNRAAVKGEVGVCFLLAADENAHDDFHARMFWAASPFVLVVVPDGLAADDLKVPPSGFVQGCGAVHKPGIPREQVAIKAGAFTRIGRLG